MLCKIRSAVVLSAFILATASLSGCSDSAEQNHEAGGDKQNLEKPSEQQLSQDSKSSQQESALIADTSTPTGKFPATSSDGGHDSDLVAVNFEQWGEIKKENIPNILVVDMWASWCVPCLERFPAMVEMSEQYAESGVQFLSLSLDDREDQSSLDFANQFLAKQNAHFPHYFLDEHILDGFEKLDLQTVPAVDIFDLNGKLLIRLTGDNPNKQFTEEDIEHQLQSLIKLN